VIRFFRTPKGLMIVVLATLAGAAVFGPDANRIWPGLFAAVVAAMVVDAPILRFRGARWEFPDGALLTGCFVAMVLSPFEPWWVPAVTAAFGVASKYAIRTRSANVFNPAALALVVSFYVFNTGQSWWGALPEMHMWAVALLFAVGVFITDRVNKMPLVLAFLGSYFLLFTVTSFFGDPRGVVEIFREPDVNAVLFFAFFILTDPPTSPAKYRDQVTCAVIVAVAGYGVFEWTGAAHYLLAGVLVGNVWEAWRRVHARTVRHRPAATRDGVAGITKGARHGATLLVDEV
jgi:Na+-translocating ferredoxin:NAD+ oxidoreductase RnfD subunit